MIQHFTFNENCNNITIQKTSGTNCNFGQSCNNITFASGHYDKCNFDKDCNNLTFSKQMINCNFGQSCNNITFTISLHNITFEDNVAYLSILFSGIVGTSNSGLIDNYRILQGTAGNSSQSLVVKLGSSNLYTQNIGLDSNGTLEYWVPADTHNYVTATASDLTSLEN